MCVTIKSSNTPMRWMQLAVPSCPTRKLSHRVKEPTQVDRIRDWAERCVELGLAKSASEYDFAWKESH
jgi:hypothetical protein